MAVGSAACGASSTASAVEGVDAGEQETLDALAQGDLGSVEADAQDFEADAAQTPLSDATIEPVGCVTDVSAGHHRFACKGIDYDVEVPASCAAGGCGMVIEVHGMTMDADQQDKNTGLRALGIQHGFIVVQPTAPMSAVGRSWTPWVDDAKVWEVVQDARTAFAVDPRRIHVTGFSQGGAMTWRMICKHADVIASAAPVAAADASSWTVMPPYILDCPFTQASSPVAQIAILQMHGRSDSVVAFAKGASQRDAVLQGWQMQQQVVVSSDEHHDWTRYANAQATIYEFIEHDYLATLALVPVAFAGHCLPGSTDLNTNATPGETMFFGCAPPNGFIWGEAMMQFFLAHPKS
jgi:poly(3-hydroxybutyrate) depolymerase